MAFAWFVYTLSMRSAIARGERLRPECLNLPKRNRTSDW
jgi:hypothetical protein